MQFSFAVVAAAAITLVNAVQITNTPQSFVGVKAGTPLNITWSGADGAVTLTLKDGPSTALTTVEVIASGQTGTSFIWTPSTSLTDDTYALQIDDSTGTPNYSVQFAITGGVASSSVSSGSSTASSTASSTGSSSSASSTGSSSAASATTSSNSTSTQSSSSSTGTGSTTTSGSSSRTGSSTSSSASSTGTTAAPPNSNGAGSIASPLAFILLAFAALMTLN